MPIDLYPYLEVMITDWEPIARTTGNRVRKEYTGQIRLWQRQTDTPNPTPESRIITVPSYDFVQKLADSVETILSRPVNRNLQGLVLSEPPGAVETFTITTAAYGLDNRINTIDNGAILNFSCITWETF